MNARDLSKLKLFTVLAPVCFVLLSEVFRTIYLEGNLHRAELAIIVIAWTQVAALIFSELIFGQILRMQRLLDRERQRIEGIFLHTSEAVILLDERGRVVAMNPAGFGLTGFEAGEVQGGQVAGSEIFAGVGAEMPPWWDQVWARGRVPYFEATALSAAGNVMAVTGSATIIPAPEGGTQVALIMRDISERKTLEAEVERRRAQAEGLYDIGLDLASLIELNENLRTVLRKIKGILGADLAGWAFVDEGDGEPDWQVIEDHTGERPPVTLLDHPDELVRQAVESAKPVIEEQPCVTLIAVPVLLRNQPVGALLVGSWQPGRISRADILFLSSVTTQAAVALENRDLYARGQGQAILEERERLAKEMHDGFGQTLTYLSAMVATMETLLRKGKGQREEALEKLVETREMLSQAHQEVRQAIFNLRERPSEGDFNAQVSRLLDQLGEQAGIETEFKTDGKTRVKLPFETEIQVLRVIQEALANVRKHAGATTASVYIARRGDALEITVADNGRGFRPEAVLEGQHFGLRIMQERSQAVGGTLQVESSPGGRGTRVHLTVPLRRWAGPALSRNTVR